VKERSAPAEVVPAGPSTVDASSIVDFPPLFETTPKPSKKTVRTSMGIVTIAWVFGSVWTVAISGTPLTQFARGLEASRFQFGVLAAIPFLASLAALPASLLIERTGQRKRIFFWGLYFQRLLWIPIALVPLAMVHYWGQHAVKPAMGVFLALMLLMHMGNAIGGPAWTSWMSDLVPDRIRGRYFCRRRQFGILSVIPAALIVGWVLDHYHSGNTVQSMGIVAIVFCVACVFGIADIALFHAVPDIPKAPVKGAHLIKSFTEPLRDRHFLFFAGFVGLMTFAVAAQGQFVTLFLTEKMGIKNMQAQMMLLVAPLLAQLVMLPIWGKIADRHGRKPLLAIGSLGLVPVGVGWVFVSNDHVWVGFAMSMLGAALWSALEVANLNFVLDMAASDEPGRNGGSSYVAVNSVIINIAGCLGGLTFGIVAQGLKDWTWQPIASLRPATFYDVLFISSAALRLAAAVIFLPLIHEVGAKPTREALRFMSSNLYNNVFSAILMPLRALRVTPRESYPEADELK
jgi:MFS family permease